MFHLSGCAFTGHRPQKLRWKYDEADVRCVTLKAILTREITELANGGVTDFFSGMAEGADQFCAEIALGLRERNPALRLHCLIPCRGQDAEWSAPARGRYREILAQADSVTYISEEYHKNCALERNRRLVESAATVLAVYNGDWCGGTADTVRYARELGRELVILDPVSFYVVKNVCPP